MKITSGIVQIVKSNGIYFVSTTSPIASLGSYNSLKEAVEKSLANQHITPVMKCALESICKKAKELDWREQEICDAFVS